MRLGPIGQILDNMMGGNPNPTLGQIYGGAAGIGDFPPYPAYRPF